VIDSKLWKFYFRFYSDLRLRLALVTLTSILQACLLMPLALLVRRIFDQAIPGRRFQSLLFCGLGMLGLCVCSSALVLLNRYAALTITKRAIQRLRDELLDALFRLPRSRYTQADRQQLHTVIVQDTERLDVMSNALLAQFIPALFLSAFLAVVLLRLNAELFAFLATFAPLLYWAGKKLGRRFRAEIKVFHQKFEEFSAGISFNLRMLDLTRLQTAEGSAQRLQRRRHEELRDTSRGMAWLGTAYGVAQSFISVATSLVILLVGGRAVISGAMTLGELMAFFFALGLLRDQVQNISASVPEIIAGGVSLQKLQQISATPAEPIYGGVRRIPFSGGVRFENVSFRYGREPVLRGVDLALEPGKTCALVGPNGSGKSTILSLLTGLYRPESGTIFADGHPYETLDMVELRRRIGIVLQDPMLFPGTILENICYGDRGFTEEELSAAVELAAADFIAALPLSYQSAIGESGVLLSGGQRQKIALARALIRRPALLILDEPTNHLDAAAVRSLQRRISEGLPDAAVLIVSHDERVIQNCDYAYLLKNGEIAVHGRPHDLRRRPEYAELFSTEREILHGKNIPGL
jgi:ABC-type multidrug transport system fused ATPase/permease subunit